MDWANLERLAHQEARQSTARKMNSFSMSMSSSTPAFDRIAARSQQTDQSTTNNFDQTIRTVNQETNAALMEELSTMRKSYYGLSRSVQEIQENLARNMDLAYELKKGKDFVDLRCEEFDRFIKSLNTNQQMLTKETEAIQYSVQKILSSQDQLQTNMVATREGHLSRETFSKVMDSTSAEIRAVREGVSELFKTSDRSAIQIENLLLSIIDLGSVEPVTEADNLSLLRSLASDGFAHQVRRILTESLQAGVDLSLQKHLKVLQSSMNQSIVMMLKEYRERQNSTLLPDIERLHALSDEFSKVREDFVHLHGAFNSLRAQVEVEKLRAPPAVTHTPEIITVDETVRADLDAARQEIASLQEQMSKLQAQMNTQTENVNASTASQEILRLSIQENRNYLISEHDKAQSKTEILVRDVEEKLGDLLGRSIAPLDRKIKDVSDRNLSLSMDVQKMKEEVERQNRDFSQQIATQDTSVREEMKNLLHVNQLDHEEIRREIIRSIRSSEIISIQDDITSKTDQKLQSLQQEQQIFAEKLKGLSSEIDGCTSKLMSEKEDVRQLLNQRDLDISRRLQERIVHWENCQKDWQSLQDAKVEEATRQVSLLSADFKEIKPQENIERLKDEVATLQERLQALRSKQDVMDIGLRKENDGLRTEFSKQFQGLQEKIQANQQGLEQNYTLHEQSLKNVQEKFQQEQDKLQELLGNMTLKQRTQELDLKETKEQASRLETKLNTTESELQEIMESKYSLLDGKLSSGLQILQANVARDVKECEADLQVLRKDHTNVATRIDELQQDTQQKFAGLSDFNQKQTQDFDKLIASKIQQLEQALDRTKQENNHNLQSIAEQEEQFSRLLEQHEADIKTLHAQFQRQKELHDTEMTTTRSMLRAEQHKQGKGVQESMDEIRFDLSQTANRVLILEQTSLMLHNNSNNNNTDATNHNLAVLGSGSKIIRKSNSQANSPDKQSSSKGKSKSTDSKEANDADENNGDREMTEVDILAIKRECLEAMLPMLQQKAETSELKYMKTQLEEHHHAIESLKTSFQSQDDVMRKYEQEGKLREEDWERTFEDSIRAMSLQNHKDHQSIQQEVSVVKAGHVQLDSKVQDCAMRLSEGIQPLLSRQREEMDVLRLTLFKVQQELLRLNTAVDTIQNDDDTDNDSSHHHHHAPKQTNNRQEKETKAQEDEDSANSAVKLSSEPRIPLPSVPMATLKQLTDLEQKVQSSITDLQNQVVAIENSKKQHAEEKEKDSAAVEDWKQQMDLIRTQIDSDRTVSKSSVENVHKLLDVLQEEVGKHDDAQEEHQIALDKLEATQKSLQASLQTLYATLTTHIEDHARMSSAAAAAAMVSPQQQHHHHGHHSHVHTPSSSKPSSPPSSTASSSTGPATAGVVVDSNHVINTNAASSSFSPQVSPHGIRSVTHLRSLVAGRRSADGSAEPSPFATDGTNNTTHPLYASNNNMHHQQDDMASSGGGDDSSVSSSAFSSPSKPSVSSPAEEKHLGSSKRSSRAIDELAKDSPDHFDDHHQQQHHANANNSHNNSNNSINANASLSPMNSANNLNTLRTPVKQKPAILKELAPVHAPASHHHHHHNNNNSNYLHHTTPSRKHSPAIAAMLDPSMNNNHNNNNAHQSMALYQPNRLAKSPTPPTAHNYSSNPTNTSSNNSNFNGPAGGGGGGAPVIAPPKQVLSPLSPNQQPPSQTPSTASSPSTAATIQPSPPAAVKSSGHAGVSPRVRVTTPSKKRSFDSPPSDVDNNNESPVKSPQNPTSIAALTPQQQQQQQQYQRMMMMQSPEQSGDFSTTGSWEDGHNHSHAVASASADSELPNTNSTADTNIMDAAAAAVVVHHNENSIGSSNNNTGFSLSPVASPPIASPMGTENSFASTETSPEKVSASLSKGKSSLVSTRNSNTDPLEDSFASSAPSSAMSSAPTTPLQPSNHNNNNNMISNVQRSKESLSLDPQLLFSDEDSHDDDEPTTENHMDKHKQQEHEVPAAAAAAVNDAQNTTHNIPATPPTSTQQANSQQNTDDNEDDDEQRRLLVSPNLHVSSEHHNNNNNNSDLDVSVMSPGEEAAVFAGTIYDRSSAAPIISLPVSSTIANKKSSHDIARADDDDHTAAAARETDVSSAVGLHNSFDDPEQDEEDDEEDEDELEDSKFVSDSSSSSSSAASSSAHHSSSSSSEDNSDANVSNSANSYAAAVETAGNELLDISDLQDDDDDEEEATNDVAKEKGDDTMKHSVSAAALLPSLPLPIPAPAILSAANDHVNNNNNNNNNTSNTAAILPPSGPSLVVSGSLLGRAGVNNNTNAKKKK